MVPEGGEVGSRRGVIPILNQSAIFVGIGNRLLDV